MNAGPDESRVLIAFARAASQAQEIEALLQEMLIAAEVATDTENRSFENIAAEIERLPLGVLKKRFLDVARVPDPLFTEMWNKLNEERIFLMHKFFNAFPITSIADRLPEAEQRLAEIDRLLDIGSRLLKEVRDRAYASFNIPPAKFREFLRFVVDHRKKAKASE
jgi:hypothetical protein